MFSTPSAYSRTIYGKLVFSNSKLYGGLKHFPEELFGAFKAIRGKLKSCFLNVKWF